MQTNTGNNVMNFAEFFQDKQTAQAQEAAHNLAWMNTKLCVPLVMKDLMDGTQPLDEAAIYTLHDMISDFEIDTALLAISSGALQVIRGLKAAFPAAHVLAMECERIICAYGEEWLEQNMTGETDHDYLLSILRDMPEDFEALSDLIQMAMGQMEDKTALELLEILYVQADAHMMVAEEFVNVMDLNDREDEELTTTANAMPPQNAGGNVVAFPAPAH